MISFIIIGRNIQNTIELCIGSVLEFIRFNGIKATEIIYIDSDSNDNTLALAKKYPIRILLITGNVNAAIARNVGARNAKGEILFFLDGDMELFTDFLKFVFNSNSQSLKYPFTRGCMREKYYDANFNYLYTKDEIIPDKPFYEHVTGGLMIVEKKLWEEIGGMDERLIRNQDLDFGFRMSKNGYPVIKDNHLWIIHHTTSYYEKNRFASFNKTKALLSPGILMRKHILNIEYLKYFKRNVFYSMLLLVSFIVLFINPFLGLLLLTFYILIQAIRTIIIIKKENYLFQSFLFKILFNFYSLIGFLFYYPAPPLYKLTKVIE